MNDVITDVTPGTVRGDEALVRVTLRLFRVAVETGPHSPLTLATGSRLQSVLVNQGAVGPTVELVFEDGGAFVGQRLVNCAGADLKTLKALRVALTALGGNTLFFATNASTQDLTLLVTALVAPESGVVLSESAKVKRSDPEPYIGQGPDADPAARMARVYADGLSVLEQNRRALLRRDLSWLPEIRQLAMSLYRLSREVPEMLESLVLMPSHLPGVTTRSMKAALLTAILTRATETPEEESYLGILACLLSETGRPKAAGMYRAGPPRWDFGSELTDEMKRTLPRDSALLLLQRTTGCELELRECAMVYETSWLLHAETLDWPYKRVIPPTVVAVFAAVSLRVIEAMEHCASTGELIQHVSERTEGRVEVAALRMCLAALGLSKHSAPTDRTVWDVSRSDEYPQMPPQEADDSVDSRDSLALDEQGKTLVMDSAIFFQRWDEEER